MKKLSLLALVLLQACSLFPQKPNVMDAPVPTARKVHIDQRLLVECSELGELPANPTPSDVLAQHGLDVAAYNDCAKSKKKLIDTVRAAFD